MKYILFIPLLILVCLSAIILVLFGTLWHFNYDRGCEFASILDKPTDIFIRYNFPKLTTP